LCSRLDGDQIIVETPKKSQFGRVLATASVASITKREVVHGYLVLPHAVPIVVVMSATLAFALVATGGWPGYVSTICLLGAMLGSQLAIGAVNELVDADLDTLAKPDKPIPAGLVTKRGARIITTIGILSMIAFSIRFSAEAFVLCALGTGAGVAYSLWFKRTIWSWIPYLVALPLIPIWVWTALSNVEPGMFAIFPIGAAAVIAVQIAQSLPDVEGDRRSNVRTLAVALGVHRARNLCWGASLLAIVLAMLLAPWLTDHPLRVWIAVVIAGGLVAVDAILWTGSARRGAMAAFPCIATGAAVLGVGWTAALVSL